MKVERNGVFVEVCKLPNKKLPTLIVSFKGEENVGYKVANFYSDEVAIWFQDVMETFFEGMK